MSSIPRPEYPNPQFQRTSWLNLNGLWDFQMDPSISGFDRKLWKHPHFNQQINVPFCPESKLSGIGFTDFINACWYHRTVHLTAQNVNQFTFLHFGAVDYEAHVYINGLPVGVHKGGYASFQFDITRFIHTGKNDIVVGVIDNTRSPRQPSGKQSQTLYSQGCMYTRTTGIWQTVWLEFVPKNYIEAIRYISNIDTPSVTIGVLIHGIGTLNAIVTYRGHRCGKATVQNANGLTFLTIPLSEKHLWSPGCGHLYHVSLMLGSDKVSSYFGLREIRIEGYKFLINRKSVFQRLVLDQGFYPTGVYTAPTKEDLEQEVKISMAAGFNGARLHQKAFEPLFLYYCDKLGYLVWGEMASWGLDLGDPVSYGAFIPEWMEILERDINHPSIIGWCPFNETWDQNGRRQIDDVLRLTYHVTKAIDPTRPCIDTSGHFHVITDIYDIHDYDQDPRTFAKRYSDFARGKDKFTDLHADRQKYPGGIPFFISEYGGIKFVPSFMRDTNGWGYGDEAKTEAEFIARYKRLTDTLLDNPYMFGFCYTQLYDVEQERNGIYSYNRIPKVDITKIAEINRRTAAIEKVKTNEK